MDPISRSFLSVFLFLIKKTRPVTEKPKQTADKTACIVVSVILLSSGNPGDIFILQTARFSFVDYATITEQVKSLRNASVEKLRC